MLTRRENLLIRPWQQRRYINHVEKIRAATAVIDSGPPKERGHVTLKLKKQQFEEERIDKIEHDNVRLLQRMAAIMRTSRLDNRWINDPPGSFLGRIGIYAPLGSPANSTKSIDEDFKLPDIVGKNITCPACRLKMSIKEKNDQLPKQEYLRKGKSASIKKIKTICDESAMDVKKERPKSAKGKKKEGKIGPAKYKTTPTARLRPISGNKVVFTRGQLEVSVDYPNHTKVVLKRIGCKPKTLEVEYCSCSSMKNPY